MSRDARHYYTWCLTRLQEMGSSDALPIELARVLETDLIQLQCYEGLDVTTALYEWHYPKQLLHIKLDEHGNAPLDHREHELFSERFSSSGRCSPPSRTKGRRPCC